MQKHYDFFDRMKYRLPKGSSVLLLGLIFLLPRVHAQRSGGSFSILSESFGPMVADGQTTHSGFSQLGASESIQGIFSSATTAFKGTIGFLSPQNTTPSDLNSTAPLTVLENQPAGTVIGSFQASDPDADTTLTFDLVSGSGDQGNGFFSMEPSGVLKSSKILDYESVTSFSIRVQAKDQRNAFVENTFVVKVTNLLEDLDGDGVEDAYDSDTDNDGFSDTEEVAYGSDIRDPNSVPFSSDSNDTPMALRDQGSGWKSSDWFGYFYYTGSPWHYHVSLGWIYIHELVDLNLWFYLQNRGWLWTNRDTYPFIFDNPSEAWMYFDSNHEIPRFYNYGNEQWSMLE